MQEIIVYHSRGEAALWEMATTAEFFVCFVAVMVFFVLYLLLENLVDMKMSRFHPKRPIVTAGLMAGSAVVAVIVAYKMWV